MGQVNHNEIVQGDRKGFHGSVGGEALDSAPLRFVACSHTLTRTIDELIGQGFAREEVVHALAFVLGVQYRRAGRSLPATATVRQTAPDMLEGYRCEAMDAAAREQGNSS